MQGAGKFVSYLVLIWLLAVIPFVKIFGQEYSLKNYAVDDGVPSPEVYCALQDADGYIWFGTDRGVCKFNGYKFETFTTAEGLCYNTVFQIHQDHKKRIWFISNSNQLCYYQGAKIFQHPANPELKKQFPDAYFGSFYSDLGDTVWLTVKNIGIIKITPEHKILTVKNPQQLYIKTFNSKNYIYTGGKSNILTIDEGSSAPKKDLTFTENTFNNPLITRTSANEYLIAHGFRNNILTRIYDGEIKQTFTLNYQVICALKTNTDEFWIGSRSDGLYCYKNNNFASPSHRLLRNTTITSILKDKEGNFWLTTLEDGIYLLRALNVLSYPAIDEEDNNKYLASFADDKNLWIGTDNGYTYKVDQKNTFTRYEKLASAVTSIIKTKDNRIWIGSNSGMHEISGNKLLNINTEPTMLRVYNGYNEKMFGSRGKYLYLFNKNWEYCAGKKAGENGYIDAVSEDKNGIIWLACNDGVWTYDPNKKIYGKLPSVNVRINDLKFTKDETLCLASQGNGVILIENGKQKVFNKNNGLLSNLCNHIYIDDKENIWVSTYRGLNCLIKNRSGEYKIRTITAREGLISNEIQECCKFGNNLWVFTGNGISVFDPDKIKPDTFSPPTYITDVKVNAESISTQLAYSLNYQQNNITVEFAGLYFKNAGKVKYRYKLQGIDSAWHYTENTSVQYGALQPGKYVFLVAAQNNAGFWSASPSKILFDIQPPFWQMLWFRLLILVLLLGFIFLVIRFRIRYLVNRRNVINELEVYKSRALQARMNPHFIFNSLNSINNYILQNDKQNSSRYLSKFGNLMRFILDNSAKTDIALEAELRGLKLYLELEKQRFKEKLNYSIEVAPDVNTLTTKIPALILQPFVENAILHGILPKQEPGNVLIQISIVDGKINCVIEDDGIGRKRSLEKSDRKAPKHVSNGIEVTKQRLDIINKLHNESTKFIINDKYDEAGEPAGTIVTLSWPIY